MPELGRIAEPLRKFIDFVMRRVDYFALYPCEVAAQTDQTLELIPDDDRFKGFGLTKVPIKTGAPGYEYDVPTGTRVLLGFEAGDPKRPFAALWEASGDVDEIRFDGGSEDIARTNDSVHLGFLVGDLTKDKIWYATPIEVGGIIIPGLYTEVADGNPNDPLPPDLTTPNTALTGLITSGNTKLKA